jgi:hypothetical protein
VEQRGPVAEAGEVPIQPNLDANINAPADEDMEECPNHLVEDMDIADEEDSDVDSVKLDEDDILNQQPRSPRDEARGEDHGYNDASASGATKRQRLSAMSSAMGSVCLDKRLEALSSIMPLSTARRLIAELEKENKSFPGKQMNHRQRRTAAQREQSSKIVSEVYSPPRMAAAAARHGLKSGMSLD